jgi:hypothetical protein
LEVLKCRKIQQSILPCDKFNFVTKIMWNFVIFRDTKFSEILRNKKIISRNTK